MCSLIRSTKAEMQIRDCWFICLLLNVATLILLLRVDLLQYSRSLYEDGLLSIKVLHYDPVLMYYWDTEQHHGAQDVYTEYSSTWYWYAGMQHLNHVTRQRKLDHHGESITWTMQGSCCFVLISLLFISFATKKLREAFIGKRLLMQTAFADCLVVFMELVQLI